MSFQWTLIASYLYIEVAAVILLLLPFISSSRWQRVLKSRFLLGLGQQVHIYYYIFLALLVLCLLDAVREMNKYNPHDEASKDPHQHFETELRNQMKLFRAQRNFYITGFSLFLMFVIRRLASLILTQATLAATSAAAMRQATSATRTAEQLLSQQQENQEGSKMDQNTLKNLETELSTTKKDLSKAVKELEAMKSQAESVSREYDRLMEEHSKLQRQLVTLENNQPCKKDD